MIASDSKIKVDIQEALMIIDDLTNTIENDKRLNRDILMILCKTLNNKLCAIDDGVDFYKDNFLNIMTSSKSSIVDNNSDSLIVLDTERYRNEVNETRELYKDNKNLKFLIEEKNKIIENLRLQKQPVHLYPANNDMSMKCLAGDKEINSLKKALEHQKKLNKSANETIGSIRKLLEPPY